MTPAALIQFTCLMPRSLLIEVLAVGIIFVPVTRSKRNRSRKPDWSNAADHGSRDHVIMVELPFLDNICRGSEPRQLVIVAHPVISKCPSQGFV
ncbi:hypothetical protein EI94DRAFT_1743185 [Lactarius quietus]|nr:hypothetical protein EI94DRAFT_1743185 [Lactarius quietus]